MDLVTEPDYWAIKERIQLILKKSANDQIWQEGNQATGFQKIEVGLPSNNVMGGLTYPACYITNADDMETDQVRGPASAGSHGMSQHVFKVKFLLIEQKEDGQECEKSLDTIQKNLKEVLKANYSLRHPDSITDATTALATGIIGNIVVSKFSAEYDGKPLEVRLITIPYWLHTS